MKIHFKGIYKGKDCELDYLDEYRETEHKPDAVKLPKRKKFLTLKAYLLAPFVLTLFSLLYFWRYSIKIDIVNIYAFTLILLVFSLIQSIFLLPLHEVLHTVFNKKDSFIYFYPKKSYMFVANIEEKSKATKIAELLFPNIILGFLPFIIGMILPQLKLIGILGIAGIIPGTVDYMNTFFYLRHIPNGARIYSHKDDGIFWYKP